MVAGERVRKKENKSKFSLFNASSCIFTQLGRVIPLQRAIDLRGQLMSGGPSEKHFL